MGQINGIAKWDLETNGWRDIASQADQRKALSIASYRDVIHDESDNGFHYILIADGYRVENLSKNAETISDRKDGIKRVINYFEKKKDNYRIELLLIDNDAPLKEEGKYFASYIDSLAESDRVKSINYIGFSKCGVIGFDMIKYIRTMKGLAKTNIFCVSSPYTGTIMASPKIIEREAKRIIQAKLGENDFSKRVLNALLNYYHKILSNSHMDFDIALKDGVGDKYLDRYDPSFLNDIFSTDNVLASTKPNHFQNICTVIDAKATRAILKSCDLVGIGLLLLNELFFKEPSDGLVTLRAQQSIEPHINSKNNSNNLILSSPHGVLEHPVANELLDTVDTVIEEKPYIIRLKP